MNAALIVIAILAGAAIGSFLNVVAHRGPRIWGLVDGADPAESLASPRSRCPACRTPIRRIDLIPIASFLFLRGRCRHCGAPISPRYLLLELAGALAAALCVWLFGFTPDALLAALFLSALTVLAAIDLETGFLPDAITIPLIWAGLLSNIGARFAPLDASVIGAAAGYLVFWGIAEGYRAVRGREGLGLGDAKLVAAIGAWGGWMILAPVVLIGALLALAGVGAARLFGRRFKTDSPIAFGPALAAAAALCFLLQTSGALPLTP
ncbi:MAG: prepilin peptidase [Alphaproteobacteria bacterium]|nr:prepilin peptidase [Alphaproteobacteria bacterium]